MTSRLFQRIIRARDASFKYDRNKFNALNQVLMAAKLEAGANRMSSLTDEQFYAIIRQHIGVYNDRIRWLNNPPEGSGSYGEFVDMQQRVYAIEVYLPLENEIGLSPLQEM